MTGTVVLCSAIAIVVAMLAARRIKADAPTLRGSDPGTGDHVIEVHYSSGLGGQSVSYKVPRDPQAYAKTFIPREKRK